MNYQITEEEFYNLEGVMRQLGFINDLCCQTGKDHYQQLDMRGLLAFVSAQEHAVRQTLDASSARHEQQIAGERFDAIDALTLVNMLAGNRAALRADSASRVLRHLEAESKDCSLYRAAFEALSAHLVPAPAPEPEAPTKPLKAAPRKRQRLSKGATA